MENLIKKHEAFEKAAAAQEERFAALERLTTVRLSLFLFSYIKIYINNVQICTRINGCHFVFAKMVVSKWRVG